VFVLSDLLQEVHTKKEHAINTIALMVLQVKCIKSYIKIAGQKQNPSLRIQFNALMQRNKCICPSSFRSAPTALVEKQQSESQKNNT
jgi:hypothetical protein